MQMFYGIKKRIETLKEARHIMERQEYASVYVPGRMTTVEIDTDLVLAAIDKEIEFLEKIMKEGKAHEDH